MGKALDIVEQVIDGRYKKVLTDKKEAEAVIDKFHEAVIKQLLLGNKVLLPGNVECEIVRHATHMLTARIGFAYKLVFRMEKKHRYLVKFTIAPSLDKKLKYILSNTDYEYRAVQFGYRQ